MKSVTFPILNLKLNIHNVAFTVFGIEVYWYAIFIVSSIAIGMLIAKKRDSLYNIFFSTIIDLLLYIIPISIISARLFYVVFKWEDFIYSPLQILNFRTGGLAIYGGIIGGVITCIVFCKKREIKLLDLLDFIAPILALGQSIGRWGNFVNIEAYGEKTNLPWRMGIYEFGKYVEVHPTFLYEAIATLLLFIILISIKNKRKFKGQLTCIYLIGYGFARMLIEGLRTDSLMLGNIRISQAISAVIVTVGIVGAHTCARKFRKDT